MGHHEETFATLEEVSREQRPRWWISAELCRECGQGWLVGADEMHNDVYCMRKLEASEMDGIRQDRWPSDFHQYETLLRLGKGAGHSVRYVDPLRDSPLTRVMTQLAEDRPGISIAEIADLLALDEAAALAVLAQVQEPARSAIKSERG